jgi:hypothetical protein
MNLYPLNLVLAMAVGSALLFFAYLSARQLTEPFFTQATLRFGGLWLLVAALTPPEILHYDLLLAVICFIAWRRLLGGHGLGGKLWLCAAAGLGISLGPVLILAVTPDAWPDGSPAWAQLLFLAALYSSGAMAGLAFALWLFTRPESLDAGVRTAGLAKLLFILILARAAVAIGECFCVPNLIGGSFSVPITGMVLGFYLLILAPFSSVVAKRLNSPRPSTSGPVLLTMVLLAMAGECMALQFKF